MRDYAVDPFGPERIYVTDGTMVHRTTDGGCTWNLVFELNDIPTPDVPFSNLTSTIVQILIPESATAHDRVYLLLEDDVRRVRPGILASEDGGAKWVQRDAGILPLGDPVELVVAASDPDTMYLALDARAAIERTVFYATRDGGRSWRLASGLTGLFDDVLSPQLPSVSDVEVDPSVSKELWAASDAGLYRSIDGAATWNRVDDMRDQPIDLVEVFTEGSTSAIAAFAGNPSPTLHLSRDRGNSWSEKSTPDTVVSAAFRRPDQLVVATLFGVYLEGPTRWSQIRRGNSTLANLSVARDPAATIFGSSGTSDSNLELEDYSAGLRLPPPLVRVSDLPAGPPPTSSCVGEDPENISPPKKSGSPRLTPAETTLVLAPGESKTVPYKLHLPASKLVDLYFLLDTTNSMGGAICGAKHSVGEVARRLGATGIDIHFGIGDYKDYPTLPYGNQQDYPYKKDLDIGPLDSEFIRATESLEASGGQDGAESQLAALFQSATGAGQPLFVPEGQQASFRPGALKLILNVTDADFHDSEKEPDYPGPGFGEVIRALKQRGVLQIGIAIGHDPTHQKSAFAKPNLARMARGTDATATAPVDCDGDGYGGTPLGEDPNDIAAGEPLVCVASSWNDIGEFGIPMADAIVDMILAIRDDTLVRLVEVTDSGVVDSIRPQLYPVVNLRENNTLAFDVTYTCASEQAGQTFPVTLGGEIRSDVVATAQALVVCGVVPLPLHAPPAALGVPPIPVNVVQVPGPAPAPLPAPAPAQAPVPAPAPNPAPAAQGNPNPAAVSQRQQQPQVATVLVEQQVKEKVALQNAMVRSGGKRTPVESINFTLITGGLSLMGMFGYAAALRSRTRVATIRGRNGGQGKR